jgi:hypothetical protein
MRFGAFVGLAEVEAIGGDMARPAASLCLLRLALLGATTLAERSLRAAARRNWRPVPALPGCRR